MDIVLTETDLPAVDLVDIAREDTAVVQEEIALAAVDLMGIVQEDTAEDIVHQRDSVAVVWEDIGQEAAEAVWEVVAQEEAAGV